MVGCGYRPGSFTSTQGGFLGPRATIGCLDVAVERRPDLPIGPVLDYQFANRCDRPTTIDLAAVAVVGRGADGADIALRPYDPHAELRPVPLDGRNTGAEQLAYPARGPIAQVCVDVATLAGDPRSQWLCLGQAAAVRVGSAR
jgi:hypothetical protein